MNNEERIMLAKSVLPSVIQSGRFTDYKDAVCESFLYADAFLKHCQKFDKPTPTPISQYVLSNRSKRVLREGKYTPHSIARLSQQEFIGIAGLGKVGRQDIINSLDAKSLHHNLTAE